MSKLHFDAGTACSLRVALRDLKGWSHLLMDLGRDVQTIAPAGVLSVAFALEECHEQIARALGLLEGGKE